MIILPQEILHNILYDISLQILVNILQTNSIFRDLLNEKDIEKIKYNLCIFRFSTYSYMNNTERGYTTWYELPNGKMHGLYTDNFMGTNRRLEMYKDGKRHGYHKYLNPNKTIESEGSYLENTMHGIWKSYYCNGNFRGITNFCNGNAINSDFYSKNGKLKKTCYYVNNLLHGDCIHYDADGNVLETIKYYNGEKISS